MRFTFTSRALSFDLALFEALDEDEPQIRAVAGSPWPADATLAGELDPLQRTDELPGDRRGRFGISG